MIEEAISQLFGIWYLIGAALVFFMQAGFAMCASFITLIPAVFVFVWGQDYLEQGIIFSGLKE